MSFAKCAATAIIVVTTIGMASPQVEQAVPQAASGPSDIVNFGDDAANRMTVPVNIGGKGPYSFIIDTGSERTVVSEELVKTLGLVASGTAEVHSVTGTGTVDTVSVPHLIVSELAVRGLTAPVLKQRNMGASGILGIDSLQLQRIVLDFKGRTMTVSPSSRPVERVDDEETIVVRARNRLGRLILVDAAVNGRSVAVVIDTGAEYSIGNAALKRRVLGRSPNALVYPTTILSVTGGSVPAEVTLVKTLRVGSLGLTDMPIAFADLQIFKQLGLDHKPAMLLGMNTLRAFDKVSVDFAKKSVQFVIPGESQRNDGSQLALAD